MSARCTEPYGAEQARHHRDIVVAQIDLAKLTGFVQLGNHVQTENIRLALFHARGNIEQRFPDRAFAGNRVLDAKPVRNFVKHRVGKKSIEGHMPSL